MLLGENAGIPSKRDLTQTKLWQQVNNFFSQLHSPAFGKVSGATELTLSPDGKYITFTGCTLYDFEGMPTKRICLAEITTGKIEIVTNGANDDSFPLWSPNGEVLGFLSDRVERGINQLYFMTLRKSGEVEAMPKLPGTVEHFAWSPGGRQILIGSADRGVDRSGGDEPNMQAGRAEVLSWMPHVETSCKEGWRHVWVYDTESSVLQRISKTGRNVWEACWVGNTKIAAVVSSSPGEGSWYSATLALIDVNDGTETKLYSTPRQLALPTGSLSGRHIAVIEGPASDRNLVAGRLVLINTEDASVREVETGHVDVTQLAWTKENCLFFIGQRGLRTVAGNINIENGEYVELWDTDESCGDIYPQATPPVGELFAVVLASWERFPELAIIKGGRAHLVASFDHAGAQWLRSHLGVVRELTWPAPDGLEIQGLLCLPKDYTKSHPLILNIHGGPVYAFRNQWQLMDPSLPLLVAQGYAVLCANPRGSSGRGREFTELVIGDMGGSDTQDLLSGIDALINQNLVDPARIGVKGSSYGGYMSAWLVTQTNGFAAAVPHSPVTDWFSQHTTSNIGTFDRLYLDDNPFAPDGKYHHRSPAKYAHQVQTPVLLVTGSQDQCTPPTQALQFYRALKEHGVESALVTYPSEGHAILSWPAYMDYCCRLLDCFNRYMPV